MLIGAILITAVAVSAFTIGFFAGLDSCKYPPRTER
jgi:hypothetical protein